MIEKKKKECKGNHTTDNFTGCGGFFYDMKFGLCKSCFYDWTKRTEKGRFWFENQIKYKQKTKVINPISKKRKEENKIYLKERLVFLSLNKICPIFKDKKTTDIHHKKGRTGDLFLDKKYWIALSSEGHFLVENNPKWARENGYTVNRLNDD
jgi:hypothetical protein